MSYMLERCPACESKAQRELSIAKDRFYGIPGEYRVVQCENCRLVFLNPMYQDEELAQLYPDSYYDGYLHHLGKRNAAKKLILKLLGFPDGTKDPKFGQPGNVLDVGCGNGWFLARMRDNGWRTYGVEISERAARAGVERLGLCIFRGTLLEAGFAADFFDYVRLNHSFEHITQPNETLREVSRVLKPDGRVLIGVPNYASVNARVFGECWRGWQIPVHAFNYSAKNLVTLLSRHGFRVESLIFNSDSQSLLVSLQTWLNSNNGNGSTEGPVSKSRPLNILGQWIVNIFDWFGQGDAIEVVASKAAK